MTEHSGQRDPHEVSEALSAYWDTRVGGDAADAIGVPEGLAATVDRLLAGDTTPGLLLGQRQAIWEEIMATQAIDTGPQSHPVARPLCGNGRAPGLPRPQTPATPRWSRPSARSGWILAQLATAALLLLILVGSFLAFGPGDRDRQLQAPVFLPALSGTPATPETVTTETLLETEVAALPAGRIRVSVDRWRLKPSPAAVTLPPYEATQLFTVDAGEVTVSAAGAEHRLKPGDALDLTGQEFSFGASGSAEAIAYAVYVSSKFSAEFGHGATRTRLSGDPLVHATDIVLSSAADDFTGGPVRLVLERLTVPPRTALPPQEAGPLVWTEVGRGTLGLTLHGERVPYGWTSGVEQKVRFGEYAVPQELAPGTTLRMRNAGDDPLVLYRLTLIPSDAEVSGAARPGTTATPPG
jgi:hypothetical protein